MTVVPAAIYIHEQLPVSVPEGSLRSIQFLRSERCAKEIFTKVLGASASGKQRACAHRERRYEHVEIDLWE